MDLNRVGAMLGHRAICGARFGRALLFLALVVWLSGCSLLRFSINTGEKALSPEALYSRSTVRAYYGEFFNEVVRAADSIATLSPDDLTRARALEWKMGATSACASAVYQTVPEVAMVNAWVLTAQMHAMMRDYPDEALFGAQTPIARTVCDSLLRRITRLAQAVTPRDRLPSLADFVQHYTRSNPLVPMQFVKNDLMLELIAFLGGKQADMASSIGLMSEVMADMNDRVSGYSSQSVNELSWGGELVQMRLKASLQASDLTARADSLTQILNRITLLMESSPEVMDSLSVRLGMELTGVVRALNGMVTVLFAQIESERESVQQFVASERETILRDVETSTNNVVQNTLKELPGLIRQLLSYVVLALVVLFALPFAAGYLLGRARARKSGKKS